MTEILPATALEQHIAVLGKTGSGKTTTAKLLVEGVAAHDRVCILDPIKSDWWGLTSSADGKRPGLPFRILGGPHGHVQIHEGAGAPIGELVARGDLPLSIIDMANFKAGGLSRFFVDFAEKLLRRMTGVVYLVIEEAHLFAPKERSGIGQENMGIHWAKMLAQAGRSKGIRLMVVTQRTQALHNALLGSCDTLIAHRLISPADQQPVVKWLRANVDKARADEVAASLSSLKTGEGWICSGEAQIFDRRRFPPISTYDNTATPKRGASRQKAVTMAPVDIEALRSIIGEAVAEAEASDPRALRDRVVELEKALSQSREQTQRAVDAAQSAAQEKIRDIEDMLAELCAESASMLEMLDRAIADLDQMRAKLRGPVDKAAGAIATNSIPQLGRPDEAREPFDLDWSGHDPNMRVGTPERGQSNGHLPGPHQRVAGALAWWEAAGVPRPSKSQLAVVAGYKPTSGGYRNILSKMRSDGLIDYPESGRVCRADGADLPVVAEPVDLHELHARIMGILSGPQQAVMNALLAHGQRQISKEDLAAAAGYLPTSGGYRNLLSQLRTLGLIRYPERGAVAATDVVYPPGSIISR